MKPTGSDGEGVGKLGAPVRGVLGAVELSEHDVRQGHLDPHGKSISNSQKISLREGSHNVVLKACGATR